MHDDRKIIWHKRWHVKWLLCHSVYRRIAFGAGLGRRFISSSENRFTYWETKMMMKRYQRKIWKWGKTCLCREIIIYSSERWFGVCKSVCDWLEHGVLSLVSHLGSVQWLQICCRSLLRLGKIVPNKKKFFISEVLFDAVCCSVHDDPYFGN